MTKSLFFISIAAMILAPVLAALETPNGIYAQLCGSGRTVFISFDGDKDDPETPGHHMTACHAICADRQTKVKRKSV